LKLIFTWIEAHQAIAEKLLNYRNNHQSLIDLLKNAGIDKFDDEAIEGTKTSLTEIDPLTFFSYIYKHSAVNNKRFLRKICENLNIDSDIKDICGVPSVMAQNVWLFPYKYERVNNEIERLWNFFEKLLSNTIINQDYQDVLHIKSVGRSKLLDSMFRIKPFEYLCFNSLVNPYLIKKGIEPNFNSFSEMQALQIKIQSELKIDFPRLSYDAFLDAESTRHRPKYFRIGTKDGENGKSILPEMLENKIASIGWPEVGDLEEIAPVTKIKIQNALSNRKNQMQRLPTKALFK
jgi:5-methylcytosine-specific restriction enzyme B